MIRLGYSSTIRGGITQRNPARTTRSAPASRTLPSSASLKSSLEAKSFGETHMTNEEIEDFHLSTLKLSYDQALAEYEKCSCTRLGRLIANREVPILKRAKELLDS
jgi:hypothetical protein